MAHKVGALLLPVPPPGFGPTRPDEQNTSALDPALSVLGAFFKALIEHYCGPAWRSIAPGEPIVKTLVVGHDPTAWDFVGEETPTLAVWREDENQPTKLDGHAQRSTPVHLLWILPPADDQKMAARAPFFNILSAALLQAFENERDPCWVRRGDEGNDAARTYGSPVLRYAGIDGWNYSGLRREAFVVPIGDGDPQIFTSYLSVWTILESTENDPAAFGSTIDGVRVGSELTAIRFNVTDMAGDGALVRQSALVPPDP